NISNPNLTKGGIKFVAKSGRKNSHVNHCLYAPLAGCRIFAITLFKPCQLATNYLIPRVIIDL
ncbi:hypothetical protein, partial [Gilliamella sp. B3812]|uniref:hypothetical protein n=1 Tax=Gilliamella sp. B3812 TaxID=2817999 RepID=UPI00226A0C46